MIETFIQHIHHQLGIKLNDKQLTQLNLYYQFLIEYNQHTNLTAITLEKDVYYKHFFDSMYVVKAMTNQQAVLCDLGSGAGFPSIPLKIIQPGLKIIIVDALQKRIRFLQLLCDKLDLQDVSLIHDRAENYAKKHPLTCDYVTARAFGSMPMILEMGIPLLKLKGQCLIMKSQNSEDEIQNSQNALQVLKAKIVKKIAYDLPENYGYRSILVVEKEKHLDGFPRTFSMIKNKPL